MDDHQHRTSVVDQSACYGIQDACNRQRNGEKVQRHGKGQIAPDSEHHPPGKEEKMGKLAEFIIHQSDICCVDGNITAHTAHGDAHKGFFQCRSIVDAVSDHAHLPAAALPLFNPRQFIFRQTAG